MANAPKKDNGLLMPLLLALLGAVGIFTLVMFTGIGVTAMRNQAAANVPQEPVQNVDTENADAVPDAAGAGTPEPAAPPPAPEDSTDGETDSPVSDLREMDPLETLLWQAEAGVSNKYDGYTIDHDDASITVNVWRESITNTANRLRQNGGGADDEDWTWLKNHEKNTSDYIYDCIRTSDFSGMKLYYNVLDSAEQKENVLFSIENTDITYDALADNAETSAQSNTVSVSSNTGGGNADNFDTYDNQSQQDTTDNYVLNTSTMKIHYPSCRMVPKIAEKNYATSNKSEQELISEGYTTCGVCH